MNQVISADAAMARAIECARLGLGKTSPNPIVGAVITSATGELISEGFHQGADHAEVVAINAAKSIPTDAIIYVTLEPCQMCAGALYWSQISKIVIGASDAHRGYRVMKTQLHPKTKVIYGIMAKESKELIDDFFKNKREGK